MKSFDWTKDIQTFSLSFSLFLVWRQKEHTQPRRAFEKFVVIFLNCSTSIYLPTSHSNIYVVLHYLIHCDFFLKAEENKKQELNHLYISIDTNDLVCSLTAISIDNDEVTYMYCTKIKRNHTRYMSRKSWGEKEP